MTRLTKFQKEILETLRKLPENDRDLRTIVIWLNPNHIHGADRDLKPIILENLIQLEEVGIILRKKKKLQIYSGTNPSKEFELWSLNYIK